MQDSRYKRTGSQALKLEIRSRKGEGCGLGVKTEKQKTEFRSQESGVRMKERESWSNGVLELGILD
jgi:hypothetical protein